MKTVTIEGKEYEVPDKAEYVAMDSDGEWFWYENKPEKDSYFWDAKGDRGLIANSESWKQALRKI